MNKALLLVMLLLSATAFRGEEKEFSGRIWYRHSFTSLDGKDITAKLTPYFGGGQWSYICNGMYKVCDEQQRLKQLYNQTTNQFQNFQAGKLMNTLDAGKKLSTGTKLTMLDTTATVMGYVCKALQIEEDGVTTVYFYSPKLRVNPESYQKHLLGEWYSYMKASNGALTLKYIITNPKQHFVMISEAASVERLALSPADFTSALSTH